MIRLALLSVLVPAILLGVAGVGVADDAAQPKPNIVVILADDLGYGDAQCYNPTRGKIPTPGIDRLAREGMRFTDAHSSSGVCSPTRYTLLTGRYHWRTRLQSGIVNYLGKPLIAADRPTLATLLKSHGYRTACVGKWHLGWEWPIPGEQMPLFRPERGEAPAVTDEHREAWKAVYSQPITGGPTERGFDEYFGTDVPNWPPYCFIENDRTVGIPSEFLPQPLLGNNLASLPGPALNDWKLENVLPSITDRACDFVARSAKSDEPYFLYFPLTSPHTPLAVNDQWKGQSGLGRYADLVMETDAAVARLLEAVEKTGEAQNTLVVFTSDNGCAPYIGVPEMEKAGHFPSGPLRGYKSDAWEGGHRVPFIVCWPGVVAAGSTSDVLVQQADLFATFAELLASSIRENAAEDSYSILPVLRGKAKTVARDSAVNQSAQGLLSIRQGDWKLIVGPGSGGWSKGTVDAAGQLYNLRNDLAESKNLYDENPEKVAELMKLLERQIHDGRSTPGTPQKNDVAVRWRRFLGQEAAP